MSRAKYESLQTILCTFPLLASQKSRHKSSDFAALSTDNFLLPRCFVIPCPPPRPCRHVIVQQGSVDCGLLHCVSSRPNLQPSTSQQGRFRIPMGVHLCLWGGRAASLPQHCHIPTVVKGEGNAALLQMFWMPHPIEGFGISETRSPIFHKYVNWGVIFQNFSHYSNVLLL